MRLWSSLRVCHYLGGHNSKPTSCINNEIPVGWGLVTYQCWAQEVDWPRSYTHRVSNMVSHHCLHMRQYVLFWWIRCIIGLILPQFLKLYFDISKLICIYRERERVKEWNKETQEWNIQKQRNRAISPGFGAHIDSWGWVLRTQELTIT